MTPTTHPTTPPTTRPTLRDLPAQTHPPHPAPAPAAQRAPWRRSAAVERPLTVAALLCLGLLGGAPAGAAVPTADHRPMFSERPPMTPLATPDVAPAAPRSTAWWMAFDDATLNLLVQRAAERERGLASLAGTGGDTQGVERQVVAAYLGARVLSARWLTLNGVREAADRQRQLLTVGSGRGTDGGEPVPPATTSATRPAQQATLNTLDARLRTVEQLQAGLAGERDRLLSALAAHCGIEPVDLADMLAPVLSKVQVPVFASGVPSKLPRTILRARSDVAQAEAAAQRSARLSGQQQAQVVDWLREAQGWIEPVAVPSMRKVSSAPQSIDPDTTSTARSTSEAPAPTQATPELDALRRLMAQATQEVAQQLRQLNERAADLAAESQRADTTRLAYLAARDRLKTGEVTEWQVLEQYQQLLAASDRQAAAGGELALAWLKLVASTGASDQVLVR